MDTMTISGSRETSPAMEAIIREKTAKVLNAGWRINVGGAIGTDAIVMDQAVSMGKADQLNIYLPKNMENQPITVKSLTYQCQAQGSTVFENAAGTNLNYIESLGARNDRMIAECDAVQVFQNNNSNGTGRVIKESLASGKPIFKNSFLSGILRSSTLLNSFGALGAILGAIVYALDQKAYDDQKAYIESLMDKPVEDMTDEEKNFLINSGLMSNNGDYTGTDIDSAIMVSGAGSGHRGNPYHDKDGKFCSAGEAVTVSA